MAQTADRLGITRRQLRYMIEQGRLAATKVGGRWQVDEADLPLSGAQQQARARRDASLRDTVDRALDLDRKPRYSVRDLKAAVVAVPLLQHCRERLGDDDVAVRELRLAIDELAIGYHRFIHADKRAAYAAARDAAARAAAALLLSADEEAGALLDTIEQELMPAIAGILRRMLHALAGCDDIGRQLGGWRRHLLQAQ